MKKCNFCENKSVYEYDRDGNIINTCEEHRRVGLYRTMYSQKVTA